MHGFPERRFGVVYLVGAGPGDPDLLTLRAARLLETADAVAHDRLVSDGVLSLVSPAAERVFVGKRPGRHHCTQDRIHAVLLDLASRHHTVVRLKGGDPFVFGRGGEEAEFLAAHGVEVRVVPGITTAAACGALCGVPLTHRGLATGVRFVTGHCQADAPLSLNWASLADPDTTLVVYMGLQTLPQIVAGLTAHGLPGNTPVLAVENCSTPRERRLKTLLASCVDDVSRAGLEPPTLFIIGRVAAMADAPALSEQFLPDPQAASLNRPVLAVVNGRGPS